MTEKNRPLSSGRAVLGGLCIVGLLVASLLAPFASWGETGGLIAISAGLLAALFLLTRRGK